MSSKQDQKEPEVALTPEAVASQFTASIGRKPRNRVATKKPRGEASNSELIQAGRLAMKRVTGSPFDESDCPADSEVLTVVIRHTASDHRLREYAEAMLLKELTTLGYAVISTRKEGN